MSEVKNINTSHGTIQYRSSGSGKPLLLVHGLFTSMDTFAPLFDALSSQRRLVAFDFPDHGHSTPGPDFHVDWQGYSDVIFAVAEGLGLDEFDLCGHSLGGGAAALFASQYPEKVSRLILIDSVTGRFRLPMKGRIPQIPLLGDFVFKVLYREKMFFSYFENDVYFDKARINTERVQAYYRGFDRNRASILKAVRATKNPTAVLDSLPRVEADTLVIWGRQDPLIPLFVGNETVRKVKRASLQIVDDCGHSPVEECPAETCALISEFLSS